MNLPELTLGVSSHFKQRSCLPKIFFSLVPNVVLYSFLVNAHSGYEVSTGPKAIGTIVHFLKEFELFFDIVGAVSFVQSDKRSWGHGGW